jgi:hypothetical protein
MLKYDEFVQIVNENAFYTPFTNYIGSIEGQDYSGDPDTDPRLWRTRAAQEKKLACGYYFNGKPGFIAPRYFSIFLDAFRPRLTMEERYLAGKLGRYEWDLWSIINKSDRPLSWSDFWQRMNIKDKAERRKLEAALVQLQMTFDVTISGDIDFASKKTGEVYTQCLGYVQVDNWIPAEWIKMNPRMEHEEALELIYKQAEKISNSGEAQKAFHKSLKLYKSFY